MLVRLINGIVKRLIKKENVTEINANDKEPILGLKKKFIHEKRGFIHNEKSYIVDCLSCHAVPGTIETAISLIYDRIEGSSNLKMLNVGGGVGQVTEIFKEIGLDVVNVDLHAENSIDSYKVDLNIDDLPFESNKFDFILCQEVIEHLENPWKLLRDVNRVLKNNGYLILTTPNILSKNSKKIFMKDGYFYWFTPDRHSYHINPIPLWEIELISDNVGFEIDSIYGNGEYYIKGSNNTDKIKNIILNNNECILILMKKRVNA